MLRHYQIVNNKIEETADEKSPILMSVNPDEKEKRFLIDTYCLDEHTLNSALDPDEPARLECEPNHIAIVFKRPKNYSGEDQLLFKATTVGVFFFGEFLIVVLSEDTNLFEGKPFSRVSSPREVLLKSIYRSIFPFLEHISAKQKPLKQSRCGEF